jgi:glycosyltransferase family protein
MKYKKLFLQITIDVLWYFLVKFKYRFPKVLSLEETIDNIINNKVSVSRFGDGEFNLMSMQSIGFQEADQLLSQRLKEILVSNPKNCIICIPGTLSTLRGMTFKAQIMWMHLIGNYYKNYKAYLNVSRTYPNALFTRPYMDIADKSNSEKLFRKLKNIWNQRKILIIEGEASRLGIGNDLFSNSLEIKRIVTSSSNAFLHYSDILNFTKTVNKEYLILIALGPTATVLSYDLSSLGYQAIDIGHIDIEYEWFNKRSLKKVPIDGKFVNELGSKGKSEILENSEAYNSQVIYKEQK